MDFFVAPEYREAGLRDLDAALCLEGYGRILSSVVFGEYDFLWHDHDELTFIKVLLNDLILLILLLTAVTTLLKITCARAAPSIFHSLFLLGFVIVSYHKLVDELNNRLLLRVECHNLRHI